MWNCTRSGTIFPTMENDNNGNFQWSSDQQYVEHGVQQWSKDSHQFMGSSSSSDWGVYTTEDVDDRARYYDQYYSGREGLTVLFGKYWKRWTKQ